MEFRASLRAAACCVAVISVLLAGTTRLSAQTSGDLPDRPVVRTIAGSGVLGIADGPAARAQFVMPTGIAYAPNGDLIIADAGAQRIRALGRDGIVRTVAGGGALNALGTFVVGGYVDGPVAQARFRNPSAVAVDASGTIYVADTDNRAIRKIAGGVVTTLSGNPNRKTPTDGAPAVSAFAAPHGIVVDNATHNLYVADIGGAVRRIFPDGSVTTLKIDGISNTVTQVALLESQHLLYLTDRAGITIVDITDPAAPKRIYRWAAPGTEGDVAFGVPFGVAPIDANDVVYTDIYTHAVRFFEADKVSPYSRILSAETGENPQVNGSGFRDGAGERALFDVPAGIVRSPRGTFIVADGGNKRIRELSAFDARSGASEPHFEAGDRDREFRVALIGNSFAWTGTSPANTSAGWLQRDLAQNASLRATGKRPRTYPIRLWGLSVKSAGDYLREYLADGQIDQLVLLINSNWISIAYGRVGRGSVEELGTSWIADFTQQLKTLREEAAKLHVPMMIMTMPYAYELGPQETYSWGIVGKPDGFFPQSPDADYASVHERMISAIAASGIPYVDGWRIAAEELRSPQHRALYPTAELHMNEHGLSLIGGAIARYLEARRPWGAAVRPAPAKSASPPAKK